MTNIHTLDSLNNSNSGSNITTPGATLDCINDGTQLLPVLKLRASNNEINNVISALDRSVEENYNYFLSHGSSSISESFPSLYPQVAPGEDEVIVKSLFDIIKNIYNNIINSGVDIDENNINTLSNLIRNDP